MTPTQKAAMEQALEALDTLKIALRVGMPEYGAEDQDELLETATTALRAALAETAEPVAIPGEHWAAAMRAKVDGQVYRWSRIVHSKRDAQHAARDMKQPIAKSDRWSVDVFQLFTTPQPPAPAPAVSLPEAMKVVIATMQSDPDYAWSWHCNVAMGFVDSGGDPYTANQGAARFMRILANVEPAHELPQPPAQAEEPVAHSVISGALFDFMGWLTSRKERLVLSSTDDASPAVEAITAFAKMRGLSLDDAKVQDWNTAPQPPAPAVECDCEELPPLPETNTVPRDYFTADQMREFARAAIAAHEAKRGKK